MILHAIRMRDQNVLCFTDAPPGYSKINVSKIFASLYSHALPGGVPVIGMKCPSCHAVTYFNKDIPSNSKYCLCCVSLSQLQMVRPYFLQILPYQAEHFLEE